MSEGMRSSTQSWAAEEFRHSKIEDVRWRKRLVQMGAQAARRPAGRVTETFGDDAGRQGAYGLLESEVVAPEQVASAIFAASAQRSAAHEFVFCPVDGTSLKLVDHEHRKDFGSIGTHASGARGLKVMNAMLLSPLGIPVGLSAQKWWTRPHRRRRKHRDSLPPERKETGHWLEVIRQTPAGDVATRSPNAMLVSAG